MPSHNRSNHQRIASIVSSEHEDNSLAGNNGGNAANYNHTTELFQAATIDSDHTPVKECVCGTVKSSFIQSLKSGDHIAASRRYGLYDHHGVYEVTDEGQSCVIHLQGPLIALAKGAAPRLSTFRCGYRHPENGGRVESCLDCFSQGKPMIIIQYMVQEDLISHSDVVKNCLKKGEVIAGYRSNKFYIELYSNNTLQGHSRISKKEVPNYTLKDQVRFLEIFSRRTSNDVLTTARDIPLEPYCVGCNNCEHFALLCKTGLCISIQVENYPILAFCKHDRKEECRRLKLLIRKQSLCAIQVLSLFRMFVPSSVFSVLDPEVYSVKSCVSSLQVMQ